MESQCGVLNSTKANSISLMGAKKREALLAMFAERLQGRKILYHCLGRLSYFIIQSVQLFELILPYQQQLLLMQKRKHSISMKWLA